MSKLKQAMFAAIDFFEKGIRIRNIVFVPFPIMIVPLVAFMRLRSNPQQISEKRCAVGFGTAHLPSDTRPALTGL
jgi:hypothetical protein